MYEVTKPGYIHRQVECCSPLKMIISRKEYDLKTNKKLKCLKRSNYISGSLRHGNNGWLEYDRVFRRQLAINLLLAWNTIEPGLLGQGPSAGVFCSLC